VINELDIHQSVYRERLLAHLLIVHYRTR